MTGTTQISSAKAFEEFTDHPLFKYRQCAPDVDDPRRAAGNARLSRNAWIMEDRDGVEPQREREAREAATIDVCVSCPVMVLCDAYANSVRADGRLAEPAGIWGGRTARERRAAFGRRRHEVARAAPDRLVQTDQKRDVLLALAMCADGDAESVAAAAGVPVRTANWQRSRLVTQFNLCKTSASRRELLAEAVRRGLLDASVVVADDGSVPAWSPTVSHGAGAQAAPPGPAAREPHAGAPALPAPLQLPLWKPETTADPLGAAA